MAGRVQQAARSEVAAEPLERPSGHDLTVALAPGSTPGRVAAILLDAGVVTRIWLRKNVAGREALIACRLELATYTRHDTQQQEERRVRKRRGRRRQDRRSNNTQQRASNDEDADSLFEIGEYDVSDEASRLHRSRPP